MRRTKAFEYTMIVYTILYCVAVFYIGVHLSKASNSNEDSQAGFAIIAVISYIPLAIGLANVVEFFIKNIRILKKKLSGQ